MDMSRWTLHLRSCNNGEMTWTFRSANVSAAWLRLTSSKTVKRVASCQQTAPRVGVGAGDSTAMVLVVRVGRDLPLRSVWVRQWTDLEFSNFAGDASARIVATL
eukprot:scaffold250218_cov36-Tisochrysis_lutea.AAC.2